VKFLKKLFPFRLENLLDQRFIADSSKISIKDGFFLKFCTKKVKIGEISEGNI